jgi:hypothetical protein
MPSFHARNLLFTAIPTALLLAGCPNAGTQPPVTPTASAPTAGASDQPGGVPSGSATTSPDAGASGVPTSPSAQPASTGTATLRGKVYDEQGGLVTGASLRVRSLKAGAAFDSTVEATGGSYVVNGVPTGVQLEITASKPNWTKRTRVESLPPSEQTNQANIVNFGGTATNEDAEGVAYFVSDYPEVVSASAAQDGLKANSGLTYTVVFSEPLDATNRNRAEESFFITTSTPDITQVTINRSSSFLDDQVQTQISWDAEGRVMTFAFAAPLYASQDDDKTYTCRFVRGDGGSLIEDAGGHVLGFTAPPSGGGEYQDAFKLSTLTVSNETTAAGRWGATHTNKATFEMAEDEVSPVLTSVKAGDVTVDGVAMKRFYLTFSEPMQVYPSIFSSTLTPLSNYVFALSDKDELGGTDLDSGTPTTVSDAATGESAMDTEKPFVFSHASADAKPSTTDPKVVWVTVPKSLVPSDARSFKVMARDLQDPAGNVVSETNKKADDLTADNIKSGSL